MEYQGKRFEEFEKGYREALAFIEKHRTSDKEMSVLVEWLLNTDCNPYGFLSEGWAGSLSSAQSFAGFLSCLHHALYDDGDVTFVRVNDQPRIVFCWEHDDNFRDLVLSEQEKQMEARSGIKLRVEVMDCSPADFGRLYDEYNVKSLQKCFSVDAGRLGEDVAVKHYREYECFDESWLDTCKEEIDKWKKFYKKLAE